MDKRARYVNIYGRKIKVALLQLQILNLSFIDALEGKDGAVGDSWYSEGIIRIKIGEKEHELRTLIHEMVHLALVDNGMVNLFARDTQEAICDFVQHFITQIYEPNKLSIEEIRSKNKKGK
jgi:hypothetical protein